MMEEVRTEDTAFSRLVKAHTGMVYGTCLRVLGDPHAAEDATQATFLVALRQREKLDRIRHPAAWLHRVARHAALNLRTVSRRRARHEREASMMLASRNNGPGPAPGEAVSWSDLGPHLDAALDSLPRAQREAIVQRHLNGRSEAEVARELGCQRGAVSMRLTRGLRNLREKLRRRGVAVSAALLATLLADNAAQAAPAGLAATVEAGCLGAAAASPLAVETAALVAKALAWAKVKLIAGLAAAAVALVVGVPAAWQGLARGETPAAPAAAPAPRAVERYLVKPVYFVPRDRRPDPAWEAKYRTALEMIDRFFREELAGHGRPGRALNLERDESGRPLVRLARGRLDAAAYLPPGDWNTNRAGALILEELRPELGGEKTLLLLVAHVGWHDQDSRSEVAPWYAKRLNVPDRDFGGWAIVGNVMPWLGQNESEQLRIFADTTREENCLNRERQQNASTALGGLAKYLGLALGGRSAGGGWEELLDNHSTLGAYFFPAGNHPLPSAWPRPGLNRANCLIFANSRFLRPETSYTDGTPPELSFAAPPAVNGRLLEMRLSLGDRESPLAVLTIEVNDRLLYGEDLRGAENAPVIRRTLVLPVELLRESYHLRVRLFDAADNWRELSAEVGT